MRLNLINGESRRRKWCSSIHVELCAGLSGFNLAQDILSLKAPDFMTFHNVEFSKQSEQGNSLEANCARKLSRQNQSLLNNEFFYKKHHFFEKYMNSMKGKIWEFKMQPQFRISQEEKVFALCKRNWVSAAFCRDTVSGVFYGEFIV